MRHDLCTLLAALIVLVAIDHRFALGGDDPLAKITVVGTLGKAPVEIEVDGKKLKVIAFGAAKPTAVSEKLSIPTVLQLKYEDSFKGLYEEALKAKEDYFARRKKAVFAETDKDKRTQLLAALTAEQFKPPPFVLVEATTMGVLERVHQVLKIKFHELRIAGNARLLAAKEAEKWLIEKDAGQLECRNGGFMVEGEVVKGKFEVGKETYGLAIKNGALPIVLTGELAKKKVDIAGAIRVTGQLRPEQTRILFAVEAIEVIKK